MSYELHIFYLPQLFSVLLRTDRVYERSKLRLQLQDHTIMGLYPGLVMSFPTDQCIPMEIALMLIDQIFITGLHLFF